jgi:hypothetical protein
MPWTHKAFWITPLAIAIVLSAVVFIFSRGFFRRVYERRLAESCRERQFLASIGFFTAAFVVRGITFAIHNNIGPFHDIAMHGRHIHHLVWGIALLMLAGYGWLLQVGTGTARSNVLAARTMCMLYGVGAALTLDEFALWLNLRDVYWEREGRESFEAMAMFAGALCIGIFGRPFFRGVGQEFSAIVRRKKHSSTRD